MRPIKLKFLRVDRICFLLQGNTLGIYGVRVALELTKFQHLLGTKIKISTTRR